MSAGNVKWTPEQRRGIETTGANVLVSAAAGSGKTAVLAARCAHLVCDARPVCDVDQLLVVTYTEAAAAEMKSRIERALRERLAHENDPRLERQLALVDRAQVSTIHGFCSRLIRQNFHLLGLDPAFKVLDGDEQELLRREVAREMLADRYEQDKNGEFARLVDHYGEGEDEKLVPRILKAHDMLGSLVDPADWTERARHRVEEAAGATRLESSELGRELMALLTDQISAIVRRCEEGAAGITASGGPAAYAAYLAELGQVAAEWMDALESGGTDALSAAIEATDLPRRPGVREGTPGRESALAMIEAVQKEMKEGAITQMAKFSADQWKHGLANIVPATRLLLDLVDDFAARYRGAKDQAKRVDFSDLERFALQLLRDPAHKELVPSGVARWCHKQFMHVLVDEYQDANQVQDAILFLASHECVINEGRVPNLFCVGDVKQSIYRFRLAEPGRFLERYARYRSSPAPVPAPVVNEVLPPHDEMSLFAGVELPRIKKGRTAKRAAEQASASLIAEQAATSSASAGVVIDLQANFRSRGPLLDSINEVFRRLMTRSAGEIEYDASHELRDGAKYPAGETGCFAGSPIELHFLPDEVEAASDEGEELERSEREAAFVGGRIRALLGLDGSSPVNITERLDGQWFTRPIRFRDIVILLRSMKIRADQYADMLRQRGIPVHREGGQGYFDSMEVRDIRSLLRLLDNQQQDIPIAAVLRSPLAGLASPEDCLARIRLAYPEKEIAFHQAAVRYAQEQTDELAAGLRDFFEKVHTWRDLARHRPLAELIWEIYDQTGYLAFCAGLVDGSQRVANLIELHQRAAQFGRFARQGLYRFLKFLDSLESETDFGQPSVLSEAADVVRIMSVHHSKGLEFPVVFVPELGKKFNLQDCSGTILMDRDAGLGLSVCDEQKRIRYPSLASVLVKQSIRRQSLAEELRILYVAMTRAKEHLILSGTCDPDRLGAWKNAWSARRGPMPAPDLLGAGAMIDWIGPVSAMSPNIFDLTMHSSEEVAKWSGASLVRPKFTEVQQKLARLEPLSPAPPPDPKADAVVDRLQAVYPHDGLSRIEAVRSVTQWTKRGRDASIGYELSRTTDPEAQRMAFDSMLAQPRCLGSADQMTAAEKGTATHLVLQLLDFSQPCDPANLAQQIEKFVSNRLMTAAQAKVVDIDAVTWFCSTELGQQFRAAGDQLRRELEFHFAVDPSEFGDVSRTDDLDQVMIRGRIDAMLISRTGLTVIDYKTDRVSGPRLADRIEFYRPQVDLYRRAMEKIAGRAVERVCLVFLEPREIVTVK